MIPSFQSVSDTIHIFGWGVVISFFVWAWKKSISISLYFSQNQERSQKAIEQVNAISTNHVPHIESGIADLNKKTDEGNESLRDIAKGMAVLVDRGR